MISWTTPFARERPRSAEKLPRRPRVLYAGDTAHSRSYDKVGPLDLTIFGISAYDLWIHAHASPEQVWDMHTSAQGEYLLPMHHSTFKLSDEPMDEPLARLIAAAGKDHAKIVGRDVGRAGAVVR